VLASLKSDPALADTPVILLTMEDDATRGYALGAADYLVKPIDWGRLSALLKQHRGDKPRGRVLIVDDEAVNREVLRRMVDRAGWSVAEASNGREALAAVAENCPDLILLDLMMPEVDGFEFVRLLRKTQAGRAIPVVVVTAKELTDEDRRQLSGGVQRVLQKG